jgi:aspartate/methionine/tyrosine aminotransferase
LIYEGGHYSPASEFDNVITVNGFSKSHAMTGWRLGYITAAPEVVQGMLKITQHSTSCVTSFAQAGAIEALLSEDSMKAASAMVEEFSIRRGLMIKLIERSEYLNLGAVPKGAFYCFPSYSCTKPSVLLAEELLKVAHVATVPGAAFGDCGEGHLRLSYTAPRDQIEDAMSRIEQYLGDQGSPIADKSTTTVQRL